MFNEKENKFFRHGEATRWLLKNDKNMYVGRIAAFINSKKAFSEKQPTGGIGFFECINCNYASFKLFETAKNWLKERKMEAMDGPINFGERDRYWGLLVKGFENTSSEQLKDLAKSIKKKLGTGGSIKNNELFFQGDKRDKIISILESKDHTVKRVGG